MSHEELIVRLASTARPVQPLASPLVRLARWIAAASAVVFVAVAWRGLRANWPDAVADPTVIVTLSLLLGVAVLAGWTALLTAVPGALRSPVLKWAPIAAVLAWGAILIQQVAAGGALVTSLSAEPVVVGCMWKVFGIALAPALLITLQARRAAPLDWRWTGGLSALAAFAVGAIGTELMCPITGPAHVFNWHFLPVVVMTALAFGLFQSKHSRP
jgi:hypothetical protein